MTTTDPDPVGNDGATSAGGSAEAAVPASAPTTPGRGSSAVLLGTTLLLTALNLPPSVTSVGAVLRDIQLGLGLSDAVAGILTTLPLACFGVVGLAAGRMGRRLGTEWSMTATLLLLTTGLVVRAAAPTTGLLLLPSLVALIGVAIGNVLVPVVVRAWFPDHVGRWTALYSLGVVLGTAVPAAVTAPIAAAAGGGRVGLGIWAVPAALALVCWLVVASRTGRTWPMSAPVVTTIALARIRRSPTAWALMIFFGIQTLEAAVAMGWLPSIFISAGVSANHAGLLTALTMVLSIPVAAAMWVWTPRSSEQRYWVAALGATSLAGYLGLWLLPTQVPVLWATFVGVGLGAKGLCTLLLLPQDAVGAAGTSERPRLGSHGLSAAEAGRVDRRASGERDPTCRGWRCKVHSPLGAFPLALLMIGQRATTSEGTGELSSLVQGWGFLLAATGPVGIGILHQLTGGWDVPLLALMVLLIPKIIAGWLAGGPGSIDVGHARAPGPALP